MHERTEKATFNSPGQLLGGYQERKPRVLYESWGYSPARGGCTRKRCASGKFEYEYESKKCKYIRVQVQVQVDLHYMQVQVRACTGTYIVNIPHRA